MVNIYNLCITRSKPELDYFYKVVHFLKFMEFKPGVTLQIVHFDFKSRDRVKNITVNTQPLYVTVYTMDRVYQVYVKTLKDIVNLFTPPKNNSPNVWIYTGHSDGIYLARNNIRLFRIEDFCQICSSVIQKPADLMIFDCCLCANINCLYTCYNYTKIVMAASSYQSYLSVIHTQSLYRFNGDILKYCRQITREMSSFEKVDSLAYDSNFNIYRMTPIVLQLAQMTISYRKQFKKRKSFVVEFTTYKDLECCFRELGIDINRLLDDICIYTRYTKTQCVNRKQSRGKHSAIPSRLMVVLKTPKRGDIPTRGDIFFN